LKSLLRRRNKGTRLPVLAQSPLFTALLALPLRAVLIVALVAANTAANGALAAGVTVRAVVPPVIVLHDGDPTPIDVTAAMPLADADELIGGSVDARVQLECPNGATQTLSERFHAVVNGKSARSRCAIDLKSGTAVATALAAAPDNATDDDASINGGLYAMTSHHTQFGLTVMLGTKANTEAFVVDGEARVSGQEKPDQVTLKDGQMVNSLTRKVARIPEQTFQRIATAYTQLDLAQLGRTATPQIAATLQSQWLATLKQPGNGSARKALTETHTQLKLNSSLVSKYQVARSNPIAGTTPAPVSTPLLGNVFQNPMEGDYRLDYCLINNQCGEVTAHAWCRAHGFHDAAKWVAAVDIGARTPTQRMGGSPVCDRGPCDGFASITCE
jgi:hypothetical protein